MMRYDYSQETANEMLEAADNEIDGLKEDLADLLHAAKNFLGALDFGDGMTQVNSRANLEQIVERIEDN
jgi:hypothetical protein